jgi:hypothetical protein
VTAVRPGARKISTYRGRLISNIWLTALASPRMATNESPRLLLLIKPRSAFSTSTAARRIVESGAAFTPDPTGADGFDRRGVGEFAGVRAHRIQPPHEPFAPLRLVFEADGTRKPADRSAGLLTGNLNPACFSNHGRNDSRSHLRIGDTLGHTRYGTLRGSRWRQSGSGDGRMD